MIYAYTFLQNLFLVRNKSKARQEATDDLEDLQIDSDDLGKYIN